MTDECSKHQTSYKGRPGEIDNNLIKNDERKTSAIINNLGAGSTSATNYLGRGRSDSDMLCSCLISS